MSDDERTDWHSSNWCAYVVRGKSRQERADRLAQVPAVWRAQVEAHVRCAFLARAKAAQAKVNAAARELVSKGISKGNNKGGGG